MSHPIESGKQYGWPLLHHYHIQVFALDAAPDVSGGIDRDTLLSARNDHVIAKGGLIGLYSQASNPAS